MIDRYDIFILLMEEIPRSAVEVGSLSHYLQFFLHPRWLAGFQPSTDMTFSQDIVFL